MTILVTDTGFGPDDWAHGFEPPSTENGLPRALDIGPETDPETIPLHPGLEMIRVSFPTFADGRGFGIARLLRLRGFSGRLRAQGHVLADQFAMARRAGFDEVEIDETLAARQPEPSWIARSDWRSHDYQARLRG